MIVQCEHLSAKHILYDAHQRAIMIMARRLSRFVRKNSLIHRDRRKIINPQVQNIEFLTSIFVDILHIELKRT